MTLVVAASTCHTTSYNYKKWDWPSMSRWRVLNKCATIRVWKKTRGIDSASVWADMFCSAIALYSGFLGVITGPLCVATFRRTAKDNKHNAWYAANHARKCLGFAPWYDTYPWRRTDVFNCRYR